MAHEDAATMAHIVLGGCALFMLEMARAKAWHMLFPAKAIPAEMEREVRLPSAVLYGAARKRPNLVGDVALEQSL